MATGNEFRKSDGVTAGEVTKQILGSIVQQISMAMTSIGVHTTSKTIQKTGDSARSPSKNSLGSRIVASLQDVWQV